MSCSAATPGQSSVEFVKEWQMGASKEYLLKGGSTEVRVYSLGGIIQSIKVPDAAGNVADIVLGYDTPNEYGKFYFGAVIGRFANRIANGKFLLDGVKHQLAANNPPNHLHGGLFGFDKRFWDSRICGSKLELSYVSPGDEELYPGQLEVKVTYEVTPDNELMIEYLATCDKPTIVNLTNHSYFNLQGHDKGDIYEHTVQLQCDKYTPKDANNIPTGEVKDTRGTVYDLTECTRLSQERLSAVDNKGFDHNYVVPGEPGGYNFVGRVVAGGRGMDVYTTQPGVQLYTSYYVDCAAGKNGTRYGRYSGLCLETQNYPDAPNKPGFPSSVLRPGEVYKHKTCYKFFAV